MKYIILMEKHETSNFTPGIIVYIVNRILCEEGEYDG